MAVNPLVEAGHGALGGLCGEVRGNVAQAQHLQGEANHDNSSEGDQEAAGKSRKAQVAHSQENCNHSAMPVSESSLQPVGIDLLNFRQAPQISA